MANCDDLNSLLPLDNCYNFAQQSQLWNTIRDIVCATCTINVPSGTSAVDFACFWDAAGGFPDPENCPVLTVIEGCNIWMAPNDSLNCDLGECPAVGGTGTDWVLIGGGGEVGSVQAVFYATDIIEPAVYYAYGVGGIPIQYQNILVEDTSVGDYTNVGVSRWTANKAGFYRFTFAYSIHIDLSNWQNVAPPGQGAHLITTGHIITSINVNAIIASISQDLTHGGGGGITDNFYMPYGSWGFLPAKPATVILFGSGTEVFFGSGFFYLQPGQYIDILVDSSVEHSTGTTQWRPGNNSYPPHAAFLLIEEIQL